MWHKYIYSSCFSSQLSLNPRHLSWNWRPLCMLSSMVRYSPYYEIQKDFKDISVPQPESMAKHGKGSLWGRQMLLPFGWAWHYKSELNIFWAFAQDLGSSPMGLAWDFPRLPVTSTDLQCSFFVALRVSSILPCSLADSVSFPRCRFSSLNLAAIWEPSRPNARDLLSEAFRCSDSMDFGSSASQLMGCESLAPTLPFLNE